MALAQGEAASDLTREERRIEAEALAAEYEDEDDEDDEEEPPEEPVEADAKPKERGLFVRAAIDASFVHLPFGYVGALDGDGLIVRFEHVGRVERPAIGGRVEAGFAFGWNRVLGIVPRAALAMAPVFTIDHQVEVVGVTHDWTSDPLWWTLSIGAEFQFVDRLLGLSIEGGMQGIADRVHDVMPRELRLRSLYRGGAFVKPGLSVRFPYWTHFGGGLSASMEYFAWPNFDGGRGPRDGWRGTLGLFVEMDRSRMEEPDDATP